jgi:transcription elongation factor Elf1
MSDIVQQMEDNTHCPFCGSSNVTKTGTSTTLVGYFGGPEMDGNHRTTGIFCPDCGKKSQKHWIVLTQSIWYVDSKRHCLDGIPTCCKTLYLLKCPDCSGWLQHSHYNQSMCFGSVNGHSYLKGDPAAWSCQSCDHVELDPNYLTLEQAAALPPRPPATPPNFKISVGLGVGYYNPKALERLTLKG